jgi:3-deoxy-7-phosphoheptulonate synthase
MWIVLTAQADLEQVQKSLQGLGLWTKPVTDGDVRGFTIEPWSTSVPLDLIRDIPGVAAVLQEKNAHPLVEKQRNRVFQVGPTQIGGDRAPVLMAGPCAAESQQQVLESAALVKKAGATFLRGGAFKPRTSPYSFAGHGKEALQWLRHAADCHDLGLISEVLSEDTIEPVAQHADILQIGSRNMQNFSLLRSVGETGKTVLLKRGVGASVHEWLMAGEHLLVAGAKHVLFCERGIQSADDHTRYLLDLGSVALIRHTLGQPVIVDPSHAVGRRDLIGFLGAAAIQAGAHGLLIEAHPDPRFALSDGAQALNGEQLLTLSTKVGIKR